MYLYDHKRFFSSADPAKYDLSLIHISKDRKFNNAAALLADENDFYGIDIARFGNSINEIMDRETISGTSVLKQYNSALAMIRRYYQYEEISEIERKKVDLIPENAYREAVANALIHRDWSMKDVYKRQLYEQVNKTIRRMDTVYSSNVDLTDLSASLENVQQALYSYLSVKTSDSLENYYRCEQDYRYLLENLSSQISSNPTKMCIRDSHGADRGCHSGKLR